MPVTLLHLDLNEAATPHLDALLDGDVADRITARIQTHQIGCERCGGAAGGRIFGDVVERREHPRAQVIETITGADIDEGRETIVRRPVSLLGLREGRCVRPRGRQRIEAGQFSHRERQADGHHPRPVR